MAILSTIIRHHGYVLLPNYHPRRVKWRLRAFLALATRTPKQGLFCCIFHRGCTQSKDSGFTFLGSRAGRVPDVDFLADGLGFPFLPSVHFDFRYGANFATMGSAVLVPNSISAPVNPPTTSPLTPDFQLGQFKASQNRVLHQLQYNNSKPAGSKPCERERLPSGDIFGKTLYLWFTSVDQYDFTFTPRFPDIVRDTETK